jgi:hypothetical protein
MLTPTLLAVSALLAAQAEDRAAPMDPVNVPGPMCFSENRPAPETIADQPLAPVGGVWWIPRIDEQGDRWFEGSTVQLRSPSAVLVGAQQSEGAGAVAFEVPELATAGETWTVVADGAEVADVELRVAGGEPELGGGTIDGVRVGAGAAQTCDLFCHEPGTQLPAAPIAEVTYDGGPLVLDVWAVFEGDFADDSVPHRVDSFWLEAVSEPTTVTLELDQLGWDAPLDVRVHAVNANTLEVVHEQLLFVGTLGMVEPEDLTGIPECEDPPRGIDPFGGCFGTPAPAVALLLPLFGLRLRRRRDVEDR